LLYDWRFTANHFVLASSPLRLTTRDFFQLNTCGHSPYVTSSLTRGWVYRLQILMALAKTDILKSESRFYSLIRDSPNLESQVPVFISPRNRVAQLYLPGTKFPSHPLLRIPGLRWRYSNPLPRGICSSTRLASSLYSVRADPQKTIFPRNMFASPSNGFFCQESAALITLLSCCFISAGTCLPSRFPAMDVSSSFTISAFRRHFKILYKERDLKKLACFSKIN
jgi:hypothetical protein